MISKEELAKGKGPQVRKNAYKLKQILEHKLLATGIQIKVDLRENSKLNDRIGALMAEKGSKGVIVIGSQESDIMETLADIQDLEVSIKREGAVHKCLI